MPLAIAKSSHQNVRTTNKQSGTPSGCLESSCYGWQQRLEATDAKIIVTQVAIAAIGSTESIGAASSPSDVANA